MNKSCIIFLALAVFIAGCTSSNPESEIIDNTEELSQNTTIILTVPDYTPEGEPVCLTIDYDIDIVMNKINSTTWTATYPKLDYDYYFMFSRACLGFEGSEEFTDHDTMDSIYMSHNIADFENDTIIEYTITKWRWLEDEPISADIDYTNRPDFKPRADGQEFILGVTLADFWDPEFRIPEYNITLNTANSAKRVGDYVNFANAYTFSYNSTSITLEKNSEAGYSYTEENLGYEAGVFLENGFKVNMINQVWQDLDWENYKTVKSDAWWDNYFSVLREYLIGTAEFAESMNISMMQVGYDSDSLFGFILGAEDTLPDDAVSRWVEIIKEVRTVYHGKLIYTYASSGSVDDSMITRDDILAPVLNEVDYIGVSWAKGITDRDDLEFDEINEAVSTEFDKYLVPIYERYNKPILIIPDFPSADGGITGKYVNDEDSVTPWLADNGKLNDFQEQADAYEAIMRYAAENDWVAGVTPWGYWRIKLQDKSANIRGKPAEDVLASWNEIING